MTKKASKKTTAFDPWGTSNAAIDFQRKQAQVKFKDLPCPVHPEVHWDGPPSNELNAERRKEAILDYERSYPFAKKNRPAWLRPFELRGASAL